MALVTVEHLKPPPNAPTIVVNERLWLTRDGARLVPDGHPDAALLFCTPGRPVDKAEFERLGRDFKEAPEEAESTNEAPPRPADDPPPGRSEKAPKSKKDK